MRRGELWVGSGGADYVGKPRPILILQDDRFDGTDSITVSPLTTTTANLDLFRVPLEPDAGNGLKLPCSIMLDKISTMPRAKLAKRIGAIAPDQMRLVERAITTFLGITETRSL